MNKLYIGEREDLELLVAEDIIDEVFTVVNSDGTPYNFTGFTDVFLEIYDYKARRLLRETFVAATNLTIPTPSNGQINLNVDYSVDVDLLPRLYYYKLIYLDASANHTTISFGDLKLRR